MRTQGFWEQPAPYATRTAAERAGGTDIRPQTFLEQPAVAQARARGQQELAQMGSGHQLAPQGALEGPAEAMRRFAREIADEKRRLGVG